MKIKKYYIYKRYHRKLRKKRSGSLYANSRADVKRYVNYLNRKTDDFTFSFRKY